MRAEPRSRKPLRDVLAVALRGVRRNADAAADHEARIVLEERARIARELHDIVAHYVGVIVIQADAAQGFAAADPDQVRAALEGIASLARQTMDEIRAVVGVLRTTDDARQSAEPAPGLDAIDGLIQRMRDAGLPVQLAVRGTRPALPAALELSAYRIVQESLTNVLKHAGPQATRVCIDHQPDKLVVEVTNDGAVTGNPSRGSPPGSGLIGMRERAVLYNGDLHAGPRPEGGWTVRARLLVAAKPSIVIRRGP